MTGAVLVSAGEASGDRYAAGLVRVLRARFPQLEFFGCAGVEMRRAGVEPLVQAEALSVVGLLEVVHHIPRIYKEFRKLVAAARERRPVAAILTDSPDFHLRLAAKIRPLGTPVFYFVAPQVWAWREGRVRTIRRNVTELHCIFPFEEQWFRDRGVDAHYVGHPLARLVAAQSDRASFFTRHGLSVYQKLVTLCPGSRPEEARRHLRVLGETVGILTSTGGIQCMLALPEAARESSAWSFASEFGRSHGVPVVTGETWDALAHSDVALPASGTVTVEAALLGVPMVTYYRVNPASWWLGRRLVKAPYLSMVNLIAGQAVVPELMQNEMRPERLAQEVRALLDVEERRSAMLAGIEHVKRLLQTGADPLEVSAGRISAALDASMKKEVVR
jgi:lipid-A-disaccharide synthase